MLKIVTLMLAMNAGDAAVQDATEFGFATSREGCEAMRIEYQAILDSDPRTADMYLFCSEEALED